VTEQNQPIVVDQNHYHSIAKVARLRTLALVYLEHFSTYQNQRARVFEGDPLLTTAFDKDRGYADLTYAGTRIRFALIVGLSNSEPIAKVRCLHRFEVNGESKESSLGEFLLLEGGRTNLIERNGKPHYTEGSADLIAAYYFAKAFEKNLEGGMATS